jgi:hypothetical protein
MLTNLERFNGLGYFSGPVKKRDGDIIIRYPSMPSPYIWGGTNQQVRGKYIRDGVFDPEHMDTQLGCAGLILTMTQLDPSIKFDGPAPHVQPRPVVPSDKPVRDGIWLQNTLNRLGASPKLELDGIVGPATRNAVRAFQLAQGLVVDGLVGPATFAALDKALADGKPIKTEPVPPDISLADKLENLASSFWGRVTDLFK